MPSPHFTTPTRPLTWLITGCSSGLGLTLSRLVLSHGHTLIATSRTPSSSPSLLTSIASSPTPSQYLPLDVTDPHASTRLVADLAKAGTHIDVLVNNAGGSVHNPVETLTEEELRVQMELLYFGPARLVRAVLTGMRERRFGVVVSVSSGAALDGRESMGGYAAGKAALDALTKVLAKEVAPFNIRALIVQLGGFNTNMPNAVKVGTATLPDDYKGSVTEQTMNAFSNGKFVPDGDKDKAMRAMYEVVMGQGVGKGLEGERVLPLGRDLAARVKQVQESWVHTMEVFGEVCNDVAAEK